MDSIHLVHYISVALGFIWLFIITTIKAVTLEDFRPYDYVRYTRLAALTGNDYKGFKKVILAINYERWRKVVDSVVTLKSIAFLTLIYIILILILVMVGHGLSTLKDLSVSLIPVVASGVVSLLVMHLKSLERQIKR